MFTLGRRDHSLWSSDGDHSGNEA